MLKLDFNKLPVTPLFGSRYSNFKTICKNQEVDEGFRLKYLMSKSISALLSVTQPLENGVYNRKVKSLEMTDDPVFILGHWRSGTTYLHNVLSKDQQFGYNTTYQTIFTNAMVWGQPFFKGIMSKIMPDKRPTDNLELVPDQPQEEEFAFSNVMPVSFYNFWFFPKQTMDYCDKYLLFNGITSEEKELFKEEFIRLIKTSLYNTGGKRFLSKNPPHTARVKHLLEIFPNAKFIYLVRNPYTVFESTRDYFSNVIKPLMLQDFSDQELEQNILKVYQLMAEAYERDKHLIPEGNLYEMRFEDFEQTPYTLTHDIYSRLGLSGFNEASDSIKKYIQKKKGHKKNRYAYAEDTIKKVNEHWKFALEQWKYEIL